MSSHPLLNTYTSTLRRSTRHSPVFFFNDTPTPEIYTLSLHDALPISATADSEPRTGQTPSGLSRSVRPTGPNGTDPMGSVPRSEEHTSELQSRFDLVCRLLLEKKKK